MANCGDVDLLPNDDPNNLSPVPLCILDTFAYHLSPVTEGGLSNLVHSSLVDTTTLYVDSESDAGLIMPGYFREFAHFVVGRVLVISRLSETRQYWAICSTEIKQLKILFVPLLR